jgi:hypothetical protein
MEWGKLIISSLLVYPFKHVLFALFNYVTSFGLICDHFLIKAFLEKVNHQLDFSLGVLQSCKMKQVKALRI